MREPLWNFQMETMREHFREAVKSLELEWLMDTLYICRHSGASRDVLLGLRSLLEVQRRGRWAAPHSVKHYEKHGRVQWVAHKIGRHVLCEGRAARASFGMQFRSR